MTSRFTGAVVRAFLVAMMIALPAVLLSEVPADTRQMVTFAAILLGAVTFAEYNATYPSLVEFRDAAPVNRLRFVMLLSTLAVITLAQSQSILPPEAKTFAQTIAAQFGSALDFVFVSDRLSQQLANSAAGPERLAFLKNAAALAYVMSVLWLALFVLIVRLGRWPSSKKPLNVWVNLPMFDPTNGPDVVMRLSRDGWVNILLGIALPFILPLLAQVVFDPPALLESAPLHSLIWIITLWAFLPANLILRGLALLRIAELILQSRAAHGARSAKSFAPA